MNSRHHSSAGSTVRLHQGALDELEIDDAHAGMKLPLQSANAGAEQLADRWTTAQAAAKIKKQLVAF
jgi:hypothetical protein